MLGTQVALSNLLDLKLRKLPYYLKSIYNFYEGELKNKPFIFAESVNMENFSTKQFKAQIETIEKALNLPVILIINRLESYNRKRLIDKNIRFIEPGRQIYLPDFLIDLNEFGKTTKDSISKFSPSTQCILFYHLLKKKIDGLMLNELALIFNYSTMTISRSINELCVAELGEAERGKSKGIFLIKNKKELWDKAMPFLNSPVKDNFYVTNLGESKHYFVTELKALAHYTFISDDSQKQFAIFHNYYRELSKEMKKEEKNKHEGNYFLEIWKYAPDILAEGNYVDPLSLYMIFCKDTDERIQIELKKIVKKFIENE